MIEIIKMECQHRMKINIWFWTSVQSVIKYYTKNNREKGIDS